ncbi:5-(carboxyamino)imidazole ribonucleotide synthase [Myxosarcina sp. GI1(2024)]
MKGKRIGVIGGGQLAWMMAQAARDLELELIVQTPSQEDPAVSRAAGVVLAEIEDVAATAELAKRCDIITFENEFINLDALKTLERQGVCFSPNLATLAPLLDKYQQRTYLEQIGLDVPRFAPVTTTVELESFELPLVLKARRHGYDGQGTFIVRDRATLPEILERNKLQMLAEEFVPFTKELAVIAARSASGETVIYPIVETYQQNRVCHWVKVPADISQTVQEKCQEIARKLLERLQVVGLFGIELFLTGDERVLVNEIAPRTHNSGHYSLDACYTSQFAMQLQVIADLPLGSPRLKSAGAVMVNLLGYENSHSDYQQQREQIGAIANAHLYWYGKTSYPGRKLGHATVLLDRQTLPHAKALAKQIESIWYQTKLDEGAEERSKIAK